MLKMNLTHLEAAILMAAVSSIVMGITTKKTDAERWRYGLQCFGYFLLAIFGLGWLMHLAHG
jgi:hypothetical protein